MIRPTPIDPDFLATSDVKEPTFSRIALKVLLAMKGGNMASVHLCSARLASPILIVNQSSSWVTEHLIALVHISKIGALSYPC